MSKAERVTELLEELQNLKINLSVLDLSDSNIIELIDKYVKYLEQDISILSQVEVLIYHIEVKDASLAMQEELSRVLDTKNVRMSTKVDKDIDTYTKSMKPHRMKTMSISLLISCLVDYLILGGGYYPLYITALLIFQLIIIGTIVIMYKGLDINWDNETNLIKHILTSIHIPLILIIPLWNLILSLFSFYSVLFLINFTLGYLYLRKA